MLISAGPGCHPREAGPCSLYLLELGGEPSAGVVAAAKGGVGVIEAQGSPDGKRVVYLERVGKKSERIVVQDLGTGERVVVAQRGPRERGPQWPDWLDDQTVVYNMHFNPSSHPGDQDPSLYKVSARGGKAELMLGSGPGGQVCYSDVDILDGKVVSHRTVPGKEKAVPAVQTSSGEVVLSGLEECHHPAWRPDGQAVACFGHGAIEVLPLPRGGAAKVRPLYLQTLKGESGLLFPIPSPEQLHKELGLLLKPRDLIAFKYPDWVDEDRVVMTVYVSRDQQIISSQAVMITLSTGSMTDLTPMLGEGLSAFTVSRL